MIAWPRIVDWLVASVPTVDGWADVRVFDGPQVSGDEPLQAFTVGHVPSGPSGDVQAGSYVRQRNTDGYLTDETGDVRSALVCRTGTTGDLAAQRGIAFALVDSLESFIRADRTLGGLLSANGTADLEGEVQSVAVADETLQTVVVTLRYYTFTE